MTNGSQELTFGGLGIAPAIFEVIDRMKFTVPTPIQHKAIPIAIEGKDLVGIAQTGTGKTLAFGIPMIQRLIQSPGRALVLVPTRELALQVDETLSRLGQPFHIKSVILIGGMPMGAQIQALKRTNTRVLIATPGRLVDHLEQKTVNLSDARIVVLDEADRMLDMGFAPQIHRIARFLPKERQTLFFSATMPEAIMKLAASYMNLPIRVEIARAGSAPEKIVQELFIVKQEAKKQVLLTLLEEHRGSVLVFVRTKASAKKISRSLKESGHRVNEIHANRSLAQRREAMEGFKTGRYRVLVATDIASRGIDVKGIELVVNFDLPQDSEDYVHRIGRTGRAGREGHAISFATPDQGRDVKDIEKLVRTTLRVRTSGTVPAENFTQSGGFKPRFGGGSKPHFGSRSRFGRPGGGSRFGRASREGFDYSSRPKSGEGQVPSFGSPSRPKFVPRGHSKYGSSSGSQPGERRDYKFGSSNPKFGASNPKFSSSGPKFGSSNPKFGSSNPKFGGGSKFGSSSGENRRWQRPWDNNRKRHSSH